MPEQTTMTFNNLTFLYSCWLQIDTGLIYGQYVPILILMIINIMLIEAAGNVDDNTMIKLTGAEKKEKPRPDTR